VSGQDKSQEKGTGESWASCDPSNVAQGAIGGSGEAEEKQLSAIR